MRRTLKESFDDAAQLPERDRAALPGLLIQTLDPIPEPEEVAWSGEIKRRWAEVDAGTVKFDAVGRSSSGLFGQSE